LALHSNPRGPGFWKLNTSLLEEDEYVKQIKTTNKRNIKRITPLMLPLLGR